MLRFASSATKSAVALAGTLLEAASIEDPDEAMTLPNASDVLQLRGGVRHPFAVCPQHVTEELLREWDRIGPRTVLRHQQPSTETLPCGVVPIAGARLRHLAHQHMGVLDHSVLHAGVAAEFLPKHFGAKAQRIARELHENLIRRSARSCEYRQSDKRVGADHGNFRGSAVRCQCQEREDAVLGKKHMAHQVAGFIKDLAARKAYILEMRLQPPTHIVRKGYQNAIAECHGARNPRI